jgi:hypothetical protein
VAWMIGHERAAVIDHAGRRAAGFEFRRHSPAQPERQQSVFSSLPHGGRLLCSVRSRSQLTGVLTASATKLTSIAAAGGGASVSYARSI